MSDLTLYCPVPDGPPPTDPECGICKNYSWISDGIGEQTFFVPNVNQRLRNTSGISPEFDTRQQGTVYPMSGLGSVTYREHKDFRSFRNKLKEAIDDPGANDMGVGGTLGGATNKEPMQSYKDQDKNISMVTKKKRSKNGEQQ